MVCNGRSNSSVVMSSAMYQEIHLVGLDVFLPSWLVLWSMLSPLTCLLGRVLGQVSGQLFEQKRIPCNISIFCFDNCHIYLLLNFKLRSQCNFCAQNYLQILKYLSLLLSRKGIKTGERITLLIKGG